MEKVGLREETKRETYRLFVLIVILPAVFTLIYWALGIVLPFIVAGLLLVGGMFFLWARLIPRMLGERGAEAGYYQEEAHPMLRAILVLLVGAVFYSIFIIFTEPETALGLTIFALAVSYAILWYTAGKEEREYLARKQDKDRAYIESLGTNKGRCQSCMQPLDPEDQFCSNCGFKRRDTSLNTN